MTFKELKTNAKAKLTGKYGTAIVAIIIYSLIMSAVSSMGLSIIIVGALSVGYMSFFLRLIRGEKAEIENLFDGFKDFSSNLVLGLLHTLFIALWSLLFIIPGIVKSYAWALVYYIKNDHPEYDYKQALDTSATWMKGHKWELFCLSLSFIGWMILSIFTFGLLLLWLEPYMQATMAEYYEYIKSLNEPVVEPVVEAEVETEANYYTI